MTIKSDPLYFILLPVIIPISPSFSPITCPWPGVGSQDLSIRKFSAGRVIHSFPLLQYILLFITICMLDTRPLWSQDTTFKEISMEQAVTLALSNNLNIQNAQLRFDEAELLHNEAWELDPTEFTYQYGQINSAENDYYLEVNQNFGSILSHIQTCNKAKVASQLEKENSSLAVKKIIAETRSAYLFCQYALAITELQKGETDLYSKLAEIATLRFQAGDITLLEKSIALTTVSEINNEFLNAQDDLVMARNKLNQLIMAGELFSPLALEPELYRIDKLSDTSKYTGDRIISFYDGQYQLRQMDQDLARSEYFPEISAGLFTQSMQDNSGLFGWQIGIAVPLWIPANQSEIRRARIETEMAANELDIQRQKVDADIENLLYELTRYFRQIRHYREIALPQAEILIENANSLLETEEIDFYAYVQSVSLAYKIKKEYYTSVNNYNQTALQLEIYAE